MQRWTIRNVDAAAICAIQAIRAESGASLGVILTETIREGQTAARRKFTTTIGVERQLQVMLRQLRLLLKRLQRIIAALTRSASI